MTISRSDLAGRKRRRFWPGLVGIAVVLVLLIGALVLRARSFDPRLPPPLAQNTTIPVTLANGRASTLGGLIKPGVPTVVNFWASWCGPCRKEAPAIVKLRERFGDRVNLLYLNVRDEASDRVTLARYMTEMGLPADGYARLDQQYLARLTGASDVLIPRTLVFDRSKTPLASITGYKPLALDRIAGLVSQ